MRVLGSFQAGMKAPFHLFGGLSISGSALLVLVVTVTQARRGEFPNYAELFEAAVVLPLLGVLALAALFVASLYFRVQILSTGLRCYDFIGRYHVVAWSDIARVQEVEHGMLPFLEVESKSADVVVCLPLFLTDMRRFTNLAMQTAGADNPLVIGLREHAGHRGANAPASNRPA